MRIVLSAHFDIATPVPFITIKEGAIEGLVDNIAGVLVAWEAHKKTGVPLYLTNFEETGLPAGRQGFKGAREVVRHGEFFRAPSRPWLIKKEWRVGGLDLDGASQKASRVKHHEPTVVIVVDTTRDAGKFPAYIGNVYNLDISLLKQKFVKDIFFMPGLFEETEDETWIYGYKFGLPTFYFGVPLPHAKNYHATNNSISLAAIDKASEVLIELIEALRAESPRILSLESPSASVSRS